MMNRTILFMLAFLFAALSGCQQDERADLKETIYVKRDRVQMPAYVYGNGASNTFLLVVHGGPGGSGLEYRMGSFSRLLEEEVAVVYWDQRGQGMSQGSYKWDDLTIKTMSEDLRALTLVLRERYGSDIRIVVMGHSWGGNMGTRFMIEPENQLLVDGWIEVDGAHDMPKLNVEAVKMFQEISPKMIDKGFHQSEWTTIASWANSLDTNDIDRTTAVELNQKAFEVEEYMQDADVLDMDDDLHLNIYSPTNYLTSLITGRITNVLLSTEVDTSSWTSELHKITIPSLFLWGRYDFVVPPRLGHDAFALCGSADKELVIFQKSGHSPMINEPDLFVQEVLEFIERVPER